MLNEAQKVEVAEFHDDLADSWDLLNEAHLPVTTQYRSLKNHSKLLRRIMQFELSIGGYAWWAKAAAREACQKAWNDGKKKTFSYQEILSKARTTAQPRDNRVSGRTSSDFRGRGRGRKPYGGFTVDTTRGGYAQPYPQTAPSAASAGPPRGRGW